MLFKAVLREIDSFYIEMLFKACPERERDLFYIEMLFKACHERERFVLYRDAL